jgi:hypothetical protein
MKKLTGNQIVAKYILGYLPVGYVLACEGRGVPYRTGIIYVDGKVIASIPSSLHGGDLPSSKLIGA